MVMPAEFNIVILHIMTPCCLIGHDMYSAEPSFNSRSDVRLWETAPLNRPIVRPSDGRRMNMEY